MIRINREHGVFSRRIRTVFSFHCVEPILEKMQALRSVREPPIKSANQAQPFQRRPALFADSCLAKFAKNISTMTECRMQMLHRNITKPSAAPDR